MAKQRTSASPKIKKALREMLPAVSLADFEGICMIAGRGHLRHLPPTIVAWQATVTHARHNYTDYDALLEEGYDRDSARHFVVDAINETLAEWGCSRRVSGEEEL